jgi:PKD repeat protein
MKTLRRLLTVLPLALMGCNLFKPVPPTPINPNTNNPPIATIFVNPESGYAPLTTNISLTGTDSDGDAITGYKVTIDLGDDGVIDETVSQLTPISIQRDFNNIGKVRVYGQCTDARGLNSNKKSVEVIVLKPIPENQLPSAELLVNPTSGQYPLTADISLTGTDSDGTVVGYRVDIDVGGDGIVDETVSQSTPINVERTFDNVESVMVYGTVTDDKGGETKKSVSVNVLERDDLVGNISFGTNFHVGDYLNFIGIVQNNTAGDIIADNSIGGSLEYRLIKGGEEKIKNTFSKEGKITLRRVGQLEMDYSQNKLIFTLRNGKIEGEFNVDTDWFLGERSISTTNDNPYQFSEAGTYFMEISVNYAINNIPYHVKFTSPFNVGQ